MTPAQIYDCVQTLLNSILYIYTFHKILYCKKHPVLTIISFSMILSTSYYLFCYSPYIIQLLTEDIRMVFKSLFMILPMIIFALFFCKEKITKKLQAILIFNIAIFLVELIQTFFYLTILDISSSEVRNINLKMRIIISSIAFFFYLFACVSSYLICKYKDLKLQPKVFAIITILFLLLCFLFSLVTSSTVYSKSLFTTIATIITSFVTLFLMLILYRIMITANEQEILKEKLFWSENLQALQLDYYNSIKEKTKEIRQIRHDLKDQLETVKKLVNKNTEESIGAATDILNELNNKIDSTSFHYFTDNLIVNTVIGIKIEECKNTNIQWDIKLDLPETIQSIENIDLNCLFINLLNNAVEACSKLKSENPKIVVRAITKSNHLIIKVENPFEEIIINDNGKLITTKDDKSNHGVGMLLIENIAKKYNGFYEIKTENNVFKSIVTIPYKSA